MKELLPNGVQWIELPHFVDERGLLCFLEGSREIPFTVRRVFWITDVPPGATRGGHAHWTCHEAVFAVTGAFEIEVDDGERSFTAVIDNPRRGLTIPAGVWCELRHFQPGTACVVMASEEYRQEGYAHDKADWKEKVGTIHN